MEQEAGKELQQQPAANEGAVASVRDVTFWKNIHKEGMALVDALVSKSGEQAAANTTFYTSHLRTVLHTQGEELVLLRTIEQQIRSETLTEEGLKELFTQLDELRAATAEKVAASRVAAAEGKAASQ